MADKKIQIVTVLLPTYNLGKYIKSAINSILNQTFNEFELLIIDDGSTDNTSDVVQSFKDSRIKYLYKTHTGLSDSMNYGLRKAKNDWIAVMEADDIALPSRLEKEIYYLNKNNNCSVVSCWYVVFRNKKIFYIVKTPNSHAQIIHQLALHSPICNQGVIYNRRDILGKGGYDINRREYDLWLRIKDGVNFYNLQEPLMLVRHRKDSLTHGSFAEHKRIVYLSQLPFYRSGLDKEFRIDKKNEQIETKAWREWFYGNKRIARRIWLSSPYLFCKPKIVLAFILSFLQKETFDRFHLFNFKYRIFSIFINRDIKNAIRKMISG